MYRKRSWLQYVTLGDAQCNVERDQAEPDAPRRSLVNRFTRKVGYCPCTNRTSAHRRDLCFYALVLCFDDAPDRALIHQGPACTSTTEGRKRFPCTGPRERTPGRANTTRGPSVLRLGSSKVRRDAAVFRAAICLLLCFSPLFICCSVLHRGRSPRACSPSQTPAIYVFAADCSNTNTPLVVTGEREGERSCLFGGLGLFFTVSS